MVGTLGEPVIGAKIRAPRVSALSRDRLHMALSGVWDKQLGLIVAPAGSGKSTTLAQFTTACDRPVVWYRAESSDAPAPALIRHLESGFTSALDTVTGGWESIDDVIVGIEQWPGAQALLVVDDLHVIEGSEAEAALARLVEFAPPSLSIFVASRTVPGFDLSRRRLAGTLLEIGSDDLRFRSWEVERLFRDFYNEPLPPEDLASLARRTEGWAAGLQLFHLATSGKPPEERRRTLSALGTGLRLVREYLARNVLDELPSELRAFLLETCVLGRLSGSMCNALLGRSDGMRLLEELERRQIFTTALDDWGTYRYHEVLRSVLESALIESVGEAAMRAKYARAGALLEEAGALREALHAYCRAEDEVAASRLLVRQGEELADASMMTWIGSLPASMVQHDAWLVLAGARAHRAAGCWAEAVAAYRRAELAFASGSPAETCRRERYVLQSWLEPVAVSPEDWWGRLRRAVVSDPANAGRVGVRRDSRELLAGGVALLLAGKLREGRSMLLGVAQEEGSSPALVAGARLGAATAALLADLPEAQREAESVAEAADVAGVPWLARVARAAIALTGRDEGISEAVAARLVAEAAEDPWGELLAMLFEGWGRLRRGDARPEPLADAADKARTLGAPVLEAWARAEQSMAAVRTQGDGVLEVALNALAVSRATKVRGAEALALISLGDVDPAREEERRLGESLADECGIALEDSASPAASTVAASITIRCLGGFELADGGGSIDLRSVKPRVRAALRLFTLHAGKPVHREVLVESLWPEVDEEHGRRNLHVLLSALRRLLEPEAVARATSAMLERVGEAYTLVLPDGAWVDVVAFEEAMAAGRVARSRGDLELAVARYREVLELYRGDLLPEDGPAEWVVPERDRFRSGAVEAAHSLAELLIKRGDPVGAAAACEHGLRIDRFRDVLWRLRIEAYERHGAVAAALRARREYEDMLDELGVHPDSTRPRASLNASRRT